MAASTINREEYLKNCNSQNLVPREPIDLVAKVAPHLGDLIFREAHDILLRQACEDPFRPLTRAVAAIIHLKIVQKIRLKPLQGVHRDILRRQPELHHGRDRRHFRDIFLDDVYALIGRKRQQLYEKSSRVFDREIGIYEHPEAPVPRPQSSS